MTGKGQKIQGQTPADDVLDGATSRSNSTAVWPVGPATVTITRYRPGSPSSKSAARSSLFVAASEVAARRRIRAGRLRGVSSTVTSAPSIGSPVAGSSTRTLTSTGPVTTGAGSVKTATS